jgi:hypothetical protein
MRFRKKQVVVEAFQFGASEDCPVWFVEKFNAGEIYCREDYCYINTLEGKMRADKYDWIIQGVKGEIYPCKPDIFEETYEVLKESKDDI